MKKFSLPAQWLILVLILGLAFVFMLQASRNESATMDELAHIPAGYGYVKYLDYRLNPEHPPLIKALSALPLIFEKLNFPTQSKSWTDEVNGQWDMGTQFLYRSGNNADQIIGTARIFPIILTLLTILLIYVWSREILGNWWSLLPAFLFGLSPTILAHGHYVTTDVGAAFGFILAMYFFHKFLLASSTKHLVLAGLALGLAELMKFSLVLILPYFFIMILILAWSERWYNFWRLLKQFILIVLIAYALVYLVYFLFTLNYPMAKQISDTQTIVGSFPQPLLGKINLALVQNKITRPIGQYVLGVLMTVERSAGGNTGYFLGEVSNAGSRLYFPIVFGLKETIPALILILLGAFLGLKNTLKKIKLSFSATRNNLFDYLGTHFAEFGMLVFIAIYWGYSVRSPLNIGFRHILPTLPFIYILTALSLKAWFQARIGSRPNPLHKLAAAAGHIFKSSIKLVFIFIMIAWALGETAAAAPYFLSYFNEIGGGTQNGYRYVTDSNYDWGQDLKRLKNFVEENNISKIAVDYFGGGNPEYYLGEKAIIWSAAKGNPKNQEIGWLAVSVNTLEGAIAKTAPGFARNPDDTYEWLEAVRSAGSGLGAVPMPDYRAGTSIFIYKL
ncbi:MAG: Glycosyl transferase, family 39 [Candidatus Jorgensenbacteria bacterium GW2011_GWB1_49_9]|nr:MAG: Glycosyl transferase, family 39 [Candidatus Jorgensenbacteria bacterium GW2011_GWB1_49_9]